MNNTVDFHEARIVPSTLIELLQFRAAHQPEKLLYTFLEDGENEAGQLTFAQLDQRARSVACRLNQLGASGHRALLLYPPGLEYIVGFFGCLYAGVTAVPVYPPDPARLNRTLPRLQAICADAQAQFVLTTTPVLGLAEMLFAQAQDLQELTWLATDAEPETQNIEWHPPAISHDTLAFLQYTSGSTGTPKGVMLNHANLLHNSALIARSFAITAADTAVIWLPPYHDMGLIGGILQPLYTGFHCVLLPPTLFLQRPFHWLQTISRYRTTISGGPNFAYDLCVRKITDQQRATLDLSSWRVAFNGAEPIRAETMIRFSQTFAPCGFKLQNFAPCYGLAEATLIASGDTKGSSPAFATVQKAALQQNQIVIAKPHENGAETHTLVSSGQTLGDQKIVIVQPETSTPLASEQIGEIWLAGDSMAQGYWHRPEESAHTFGAHLADGTGPYLRTGDLGFLQDGELFITGRAKDLIIIRGRNHYPQDIELTAEMSHPALRRGCVAAFSVDVNQQESLVVVQEVDTRQPINPAEIAQAMRQAVAAGHDLQIYAVVLIQPRTIPKTSSGKIQRRACRHQYLAGTLAVVEANVRETTPRQRPQKSAESLLVKTFRTLPPAERHALLTAHLQELAAQAIGALPEQIDLERPLPTFGLDSATAAELTHEIETTMGVSLRLETLLQPITLADLAAQLLAKLTDPAEETAAATLAPPPVAKAEPPSFPLSAGQRALWFLHQLHPHSPAYNVAHAVRIHTALDVPAFRRVFQQLVDRHPSLRTTFAAPQGEPRQTIQPHQEVCFQVEDAVLWDEAGLNGRLTQELYRPFDLQNGPLMRVHLFKRAPQEYVLLLALHHIITDLWSSAVLMSEIGQLYQSECSGTPANLKPLRTTYMDHIHQQNQMLAGARGEQLRRYWLNQLSGDLPSLNLPTDRPRQVTPSYRGALASIQLSSQLTAHLKALATAHQATPFMTLLAAFQVLLHHYTGQDDLLIGTTKANRTQKDARLVGYFVNPLVIRANLAQNPTFAALLTQVRQTTLDAFAHSDYPFPLLVEQLQPSREASQSPLFQVMFSWQKTTRLVNGRDVTALALNESDQHIQLGILPLESMNLDPWVSPFDLTLLMAELDDGAESRFVASFEYSTDLFDKSSIERMLHHFETLLDGIAANPQQPLSDLPLLSQAEQTQLLVDWNRLSPARLTPFVPQQFEQQARQTPDAVALKLGAAQITYSELNQLANQLAHYLQKQGIGPTVTVAVYAERSLTAVTALLAILKAGGTYLPLDPAYPPERLAFILADANAALLLTQASLLPQLHAFATPTFCLDTDWPLVYQESVTNPTPAVAPSDVAYIIYTSGSTGKPKGVLISHGAVADHMQTIREHFGLTAVDRVLQFASFSFDQGLEQILATLTAGARLVLRGPDIWPPTEFLQLAAAEKLTVINLPPAYWEQVVQAWLRQPPQWQTAVSLRLVIIGGDVISPATVALWQTLPLPGVRLLNAYGPTETTITATTFEIPPNAPPPNPIPIGRPLPNRTAYILDRYGCLAPVGVPGELHIGGPCLANGYHNRPDLTAEQFVPLTVMSLRDRSAYGNQLSGNGNPTTVYRTGDLCRYRPDGNIEFLGRVDHQVKVRGFRIELGEIESVLKQYAGVQQTAVLVQDEGSSKKLVAYLAIPTPAKPTYAELKQFLKQQLPDYMIPAHIVTLDALPLTLSGKIDRRSLPGMAQIASQSGIPFTPPRTPIEKELTELWATLLETNNVGIFDNFFDLGGHSLLITQMASRLRDRFAVDIPLRELFEAATVADLSLLLAQHQAATAADTDVSALLLELEQLSNEEVQTMFLTERS